MKTKIFLTVLTLLCVSNFIFAQNTDGYKYYAQNKYSVKLNGDASGGEKIVYYFNPKDFNVVMPGSNQQSADDSPNSAVITYIGATTIYDLVSNGSPVTIWQDPTTENNIHAVCVSSPLNDTLFANRNAKYYFSNDKGATWDFIADVPYAKSSFPTITGMADGTALIANHNQDGGGLPRTQVYKDLFPGLGSFTRLDPPNGTGYLWPRVIATTNLTLANKFIVVASTGGDTTRYNVCTNLDNTPGSWLGWQTIPNAEQVETYALARGTDGRLGIAYLNDNEINPANYGDVYFIESTNNGTTFSSPLKIFDANFSTDSLAGLRGISMVYSANIPCVAFETVKQTTSSTFFTGAPSKIRFWSSLLPGTDPNKSIVAVDSNKVPFHPYVGVNDVMAPLCRPVIGKSAENNKIFITFMAASGSVGGTAIPTSYKDIYITYGTPYTTNWSSAIRLNPVSPRRDWTYPSVSPSNDYSGAMVNSNILALVDDVPGTYVNGQANGQSLAQWVNIRSNYFYIIDHINPISTEVPLRTKLFDNYPNPFNPATKIKFDLAKSSDINLIVYDLTGREVNRIASGFTKAGTYEADFNGSNLPSGIYFCRLTTQNSLQTIKLMLIK